MNPSVGNSINAAIKQDMGGEDTRILVESSTSNSIITLRNSTSEIISSVIERHELLGECQKAAEFEEALGKVINEVLIRCESFNRQSLSG